MTSWVESLVDLCPPQYFYPSVPLLRPSPFSLQYALRFRSISPTTFAIYYVKGPFCRKSSTQLMYTVHFVFGSPERGMMAQPPTRATRLFFCFIYYYFMSVVLLIYGTPGRFIFLFVTFDSSTALQRCYYYCISQMTFSSHTPRLYYWRLLCHRALEHAAAVRRVVRSIFNTLGFRLVLA